MEQLKPFIFHNHPSQPRFTWTCIITIFRISQTSKCTPSSTFAAGATSYLQEGKISTNIRLSATALWTMLILVVCTKINCLCLRNWRKWAFVYRRRTNTKSGLRAMILRHISVIFVKVLTRLRNWIRRKARLGIRCMFQSHLVWGVIWKGWKLYMSRVKILRN